MGADPHLSRTVEASEFRYLAEEVQAVIWATFPLPKAA
jgi:hypothetical protein